MQNSSLRIEKIELGSQRSAYQLYANIGGRKFRERFASEIEAIGRHAQLKAQEQEHNNFPPLMPTPLNRSQLADAEIALEQLRSRFPDRTLTWAVTALHDLDPAKTPIPLKDAVEQFLELKIPVVNRKSGRDYRTTLERLIKTANSSLLHEIGLSDIKTYFTVLEREAVAKHQRATKRKPNPTPPASAKELISPGTFNHHLSRMNAFFIWCTKALHDVRLPKRNPCEGMPKRQTSEMDREILTPDQAQSLFAFAQEFERGRLVNYIALALFAGVRPDIDGELGKLARNPPPNFIDWKHNIIRLPAKYTKTNRPREIDIQPNLAAILKRFPLQDFPIQPQKNKRDENRSAEQVLRNCIERFRTACPIHLSHDVMRHSFISYHLRVSGEYAETSRQAGNTEDIIKSHYQRRVTKLESVQFWSIGIQAK